MEDEGKIKNYVASDPLDAESYMSRSFCRHRLETLVGNRVGMQHTAIATTCGAFNSLEYGAEIEIRSEGYDGFYMLEMPLRGGADIEFGIQDIRSSPGTALLLSPGRQFHSRWRENTRQWMLQISTDRLKQRVNRLTHRPMAELPVFDPVIDLASGHGRMLLSMFNDLGRYFTAPAEVDMIWHDMLTDRIIDLMIANLPFVKGASVVPERMTATPRHIKRALDLFQERFAERLSIPDIALEMGVSERALYEGFQRFYQASPYDILTRVRMEKARSFICVEGLSVAEAAGRAGFRHLGRFSSAYRDFFGTLPSTDVANRY